MQEAFALHTTTSTPRIAYRERPGVGAPVLLLHGVGSSSATWHELVRHLDPDLHLVAPDYRGHGASDAPTPPYEVADFVDDAIRLLDELALQRVDVIGFSIGALFAEALALRAPDRVRSLVLLNSIGDRTEAEAQRAAARLEVIRTTPPADGVTASGERWFTEAFRAARPDLVAAELAIVAATPHRPYAASYRVLVESDLADDVAAIAAPALIATGEHDVGSTPRMSEALHARMAGSELVIVPGVRHYMHIEAADRVAALVTDFLAAQPPHHSDHQKETHSNANP